MLELCYIPHKASINKTATIVDVAEKTEYWGSASADPIDGARRNKSSVTPESYKAEMTAGCRKKM